MPYIHPEKGAVPKAMSTEVLLLGIMYTRSGEDLLGIIYTRSGDDRAQGRCCECCEWQQGPVCNLFSPF